MVELINQNFENNKNTFNKLSKNLKELLGPTTPVSHVGSTAIPNMVGKNIIDILVGFKDSKEFEKFAEILPQNGYYGSNNSKTDVYQFFASNFSQ